MTSISTACLRLRPVTQADAPALTALFAEWEVIRWLSGPPWPYTEQDMRDFIGGVLSGATPDPEINFVIEHGAEAVGAMSWRQRKASHLQAGSGPNIGFWLGRVHWGRGFMTEAVTGLVDHLFASTDADVIYCGAFFENERSLHIQRKLGFTIDGQTTLRSRARAIDLPHTNTLLPRETWQDRLKAQP